jgi:hypothetical protein
LLGSQFCHEKLVNRSGFVDRISGECLGRRE